MSKEKFHKFAEEINLRKNTVDKLWEENICSPGDLASHDKETIRKIVDDPLLCNIYMPILCKHNVKIALAKDPYDLAINLIREAADSSEPHDTPASAVRSDATGFVDNNSMAYSQRRTPDISNQQPSCTNTRSSNGHAQPKVNMPRGPGSSTVITIKGGNFNNAEIGNTVTYNTTKTISLGSESGKLTKEVQASLMKIAGECFSTSDFHFRDSKDFLLDNFSVKPTDQATYRSRLKDPNVYQVFTWNTHTALLVNNVEFSGKIPNRDGAQQDIKNLKGVLENLGFTVHTFEDKSIPEIKQRLKEFSKSPDNEDTSSVVVFVGSHGEQRDNKNYFIDKNEERMAVSEVCDYFSASSCPSLKGKPKTFFFQCCRNVRKESVKPKSIEDEEPSPNMDFLPSIQSDATEEDAHDLADMLVSFATAPGTKAYRDKKTGSWFVTALCKTLKENAHTEDLMSMLTMVNSLVMAEKEDIGSEIAIQMAEIKSTLNKKVRFYPRKA